MENNNKSKLIASCAETLEEIRKAGTYKTEKVISSPQTVEIDVKNPTNSNKFPPKMLNFCANNYLGLANNQEIITAAIKGLEMRGFGLASGRIICGTSDLHKTLEKCISDFHSKEDAIVYTSCFDANAGLFESILSENDVVISDSLNHASIIDGIRLCKAKRLRYNHLDMLDLESKLVQSKDCRIKLIVTDGVFSMDGDIAPLDQIVLLAKKYNANIMIDESHATGFIGKTGRGTPELFNCENDIDIISSTLGKALGGASGGYTTGKKEVIDVLRQKSRPYIFSNALAPSITSASIKVFEMLNKSSNLVLKLQKNTMYFREHIIKLGFRVLGHEMSPIVPILLVNERLAAEFAEEMCMNGVYVVGFTFPIVPKGQARIRVQISAAHSEDHLKTAIKLFEQIGRKKGVIVGNSKF